MTTWTAVCTMSVLQPDRGVAALLPGGVPVAVFRTRSDEVFALSNVDPFSGASVLSRGIVGDRAGVPVAVSPVYKQAFDLRTGVCVDDPAVSVPVYPVRLDSDSVLVRSSVEVDGVDVLPLAGYTVGVTAARRADELGALLERRGATVHYGPAIRIIPVEDDTELRRATGNLLDRPVDAMVATTGIGFRGWVEAAEGWGLGDALRATLSNARVLARGPKAKGAVRAAGLVEHWSPESEASAELLEYLLESGVDGKRIAVQLHGEPLPEFVDSLRANGADVVELSVYRWTGPADPAPLERLLDAVLAGQIDALAFTSAPAAASVLRVAEAGGRLDELLDLLRSKVLVACVGSITAGPLSRMEIPIVQPERARIGALARELVVALPRRATRLAVGPASLELRGQAVVLNGVLRPVPPAPMAVLRALAATPGLVLSRRSLAGVLRRHSGRTATVDEHAVETAVGRLRAALGEPTLVQTVVKRGYRLAMASAR
jgi:uroporphyrinogen-III synthase